MWWGDAVECGVMFARFHCAADGPEGPSLEDEPEGPSPDDEPEGPSPDIEPEGPSASADDELEGSPPSRS